MTTLQGEFNTLFTQAVVQQSEDQEKHGNENLTDETQCRR